jgi:hypothetical protein
MLVIFYYSRLWVISDTHIEERIPFGFSVLFFLRGAIFLDILRRLKDGYLLDIRSLLLLRKGSILAIILVISNKRRGQTQQLRKKGGGGSSFRRKKKRGSPTLCTLCQLSLHIRI